MSVHFNPSKLSKNQKQIIKKFLTLQPKDTGYFSRKRFWIQPKDPILFYYVNISKDEIVLPYTFANRLIGKNINKSHNYPTLNFKFEGSLWKDQIPVAQEALELLLHKYTVTLGVYPGFGKTVVSAYLSSHLNGLTLVIIPRTTLQTQWKKTYKKFTNAQTWIVGEEEPSNFNVIICMNTRIHKIPQNILIKVKCLIIDEAHMFCTSSQVGSLLASQPLYIIACSATLNKRKDGMQSMIHALCGTHGIFKASTKPFDVYKLETGVNCPIEKNKHGDPNWSQLVRDLAFNPDRNAIIIDLIERNKNFKIILLTWSKVHAFWLKDILQKRGNNVDVLAGNKKMYSDSDILVGTMSKIGTGFDESTFCIDFKGRKSNMMIICGSTKDEVGLEQFTGRVFRAKFPIIFDLVDDNPISKKHWSARSKWYLERNGTIKTYQINPNNKNKTNVSTLNKSQHQHLQKIKQKWGLK